jgi:hypothetical protein
VKHNTKLAVISAAPAAEDAGVRARRGPLAEPLNHRHAAASRMAGRILKIWDVFERRSEHHPLIPIGSLDLYSPLM